MPVSFECPYCGETFKEADDIEYVRSYKTCPECDATFDEGGQFGGGADGLDPALIAEADLVLSFSPLTWPHGLVRVMVAEQLYRAHSLLLGHPYHRA